MKLREIRCLLWNVEGLNGVVSVVPNNWFSPYDVVILTETFLTSYLHIQGKYAIHNFASQGDRGRPKGGISCLLSPRLCPFVVVHRTDNLLMVQTTVCWIISVYFQPEWKSYEIIQEINTALTQADNKKQVIIGGDFNCRIDEYQNEKAMTVIQYLEEEGLTLHNKRNEQTYIGPNGSSCIDLLFSNIDSQEENRTEVMYGVVIRKHIPVQMKFAITTEIEREAPRETLSRKLDMDKLHDNTDNIRAISQLLEDNNIDKALERIEEIIKHAVKQQESLVRKAKPWFNRLCYSKRKEAIEALHKTKNSPTIENLKEYAAKRRIYKTTIQEAKRHYNQKEEERLIALAKKEPFKILKAKQPMFPRHIPIQSWETHFANVLQSRDTRQQYARVNNSLEVDLFTTTEIEEFILKKPDGRAAGHDLIFYEHIKESWTTLKEPLSELLNKCLTEGILPHRWRHSILKILYKGKGEVNDPNSYRGIALENTLFKIFTGLVSKRLEKLVEHCIPEEQFGFRTGRSTLHAIKCLLEEISEALRVPKRKLYVVFIDFSKAFDSISRRLILDKLENIVGDHYILRTISSILSENYVSVDDNLLLSKPILQTVGVLQGDPVSPLLFNIVTHDVVQATASEQVKILIYADDMVLLSPNLERLQESMDKLTKWSEENQLTINKQKTVGMIFRRGGRTSAKETFTCDGAKINIVNKCKYLGVTMQTRGIVFTEHIRERTTAGILAINSIRHINQISIDTARILFRVKITPVVTYGMELIWECLSKQDLKELEKVKATYLKRFLGVSKFSPSRLVYEMARENFFIEDLRIQMQLPYTTSYGDLLDELKRKKEEIWEEFYTTDAMTTTEWTDSGYELRHSVTRFAIHGFHHKCCQRKTYHVPDTHCVCLWCGQRCERYHISHCEKRTMSLTQLSKE